MTHSSTTMLFSIVAAMIVSLATRANGAAVTLYYVKEPAPTQTQTVPNDVSIEIAGTTRYSAIGPAQETGVTKYAVERVLSRYVFHGNNDNPTVTVLSEPITKTWVMEQGASVHRESYPGTYTSASDGFQPFWLQGLKEDCKLDLEKKEGVCVDEYEIPIVTAVATDDSKTIYSTMTSTIGVTTYTGPLLPLATLPTGAASGLAASTMTVFSTVVAMSVFFAMKF